MNMNNNTPASPPATPSERDAGRPMETVTPLRPPLTGDLTPAGGLLTPGLITPGGLITPSGGHITPSTMTCLPWSPYPDVPDSAADAVPFTLAEITAPDDFAVFVDAPPPPSTSNAERGESAGIVSPPQPAPAFAGKENTPPPAWDPAAQTDASAPAPSVAAPAGPRPRAPLADITNRVREQLAAQKKSAALGKRGARGGGGRRGRVRDRPPLRLIR